MRLFIIAIIAFTIFTSCSIPAQLPMDVSSNKNLLLPFKIDTILFVDRRTDTLTYNMKLPVFATKTREWVVRPGLNKELKEEIIALIKNSSNTEGLSSLVTFFVVDGYYKIYGSVTKVGEHARFDCELEFRLLDSNSTYNSTAAAFHNFEGVFNATEKHVKEVYRITVRNGVFTALKQAEKTFD
jgi:hypothetical protein